MKLNTLLAGTVATALSCAPEVEPQVPAEIGEDQGDQRLTEAIDTIEDTKR